MIQFNGLDQFPVTPPSKKADQAGKKGKGRGNAKGRSPASSIRPFLQDYGFLSARPSSRAFLRLCDGLVECVSFHFVPVYPRPESATTLWHLRGTTAHRAYNHTKQKNKRYGLADRLVEGKAVAMTRTGAYVCTLQHSDYYFHKPHTNLYKQIAPNHVLVGLSDGRAVRTRRAPRRVLHGPHGPAAHPFLGRSIPSLRRTRDAAKGDRGHDLALARAAEVCIYREIASQHQPILKPLFHTYTQPGRPPRRDVREMARPSCGRRAHGRPSRALGAPVRSMSGMHAYICIVCGYFLATVRAPKETRSYPTPRIMPQTVRHGATSVTLFARRPIRLQEFCFGV